MRWRHPRASWACWSIRVSPPRRPNGNGMRRSVATAAKELGRDLVVQEATTDTGIEAAFAAFAKALAGRGREAWPVASGFARLLSIALRLKPRSRNRSSRRMRFMCANRISTFLCSRRDCWKASVSAKARECRRSEKSVMATDGSTGVIRRYRSSDWTR